MVSSTSASVSEHRAVASQSTAQSTVDAKTSIPSITVKMAGSEASTDASPSASAPAQTSPASSEVSSTTETKTGAVRPDPEPITSSGTGSSSPSTPASHSTSVSTVISTSPTSVSHPVTTPQISPTSQTRPAETEASSNSASTTSPVQGQAVANGNDVAPTRTSTITDQPETTLSSPVFVTVTDAKSHTSLSEPPIFTSVGVSTKSDGQLVSVTHVIANPTGIWDVSGASSKSGFFDNTKAVAATFLVVGIVIAGVTLGICFILRRRRRRTPRFLNTISRPLPMPDNPFENPRDISPPPQMRYASGFTDRTLIIAGAEADRPARSPFDDNVDHASAKDSASHNSHERLTGLGLAGIGAHGRRASGGVRSSMEPRPRNPSGASSVGLAFTSDQRIDASRRLAEPSSGRSSPSLYPPTLPAFHGEDNQSLVDVPLSTNNSTTQVGPLPSPTSNRSSLRVSSPTTRKPVPVHADLPEQSHSPAFSAPVAPAPRTPQQVQQAAAKPPVVPPRSPLRRSASGLPPPCSRASRRSCTNPGRTC
ncbi:hypothetical protein C8Q80DRAFT_66746 [Daedaleopsis nitida]|nr:hypothetical protein C8Q80DRAFT_66746 [Daedaleopsis nitida]